LRFNYGNKKYKHKKLKGRENTICFSRDIFVQRENAETGFKGTLRAQGKQRKSCRYKIRYYMLYASFYISKISVSHSWNAKKLIAS